MSAIDFGALRSIAVFRALQLGDLLCTVPALRALRAAAPAAHIALIGLPWAKSFVERFDAYIDEFIEFPGYPGLPEREADLARLPGFFAAMQARRFDLALQLHGSGMLTNPLVARLGAVQTAGSYPASAYCPDPALFRPWAEEEHEVLRFVRLMEFIGAPAQGVALEFPLLATDYAELDAAGLLIEPGSYVCVHPGARLPSRRWSPQRFAEVADQLAAHGLQVILTGSPSERDVVDAVQEAMHYPATNACGKTGLGDLAALIAGARLIVSNDTGISHVAVGVGTPSVIVCSGADPVRWAPLDGRRHRVFYAEAPCRPCAHIACPYSGHPCASAIATEAVAFAALELCKSQSIPPPFQARVRAAATTRISHERIA